MLKTKVLKLLSIVLVIGLVFGAMPTILAEETTETTVDSTENVSVTAGLTPDSILYVFDRLLENIQITLTIDDTKKTLLLMTISEERLAEAEYLIELAKDEEVNDEEWNQLIQNVVDDYRTKVDKAIEITEKLVYDTDEDTKAELDIIIDKIITTVNFDSEALKNNDQINEVKNGALLVANVVSELDREKVEEIRDLGVGYGQISQIFALAETTGKDLDEIAALFTIEKMGLGQAAVELEINMADFAKSKNSTSPVNENPLKLNNAFNNYGDTSENQLNNQIKENQNNGIVEINELGEDNTSNNDNKSNSTKEDNNISTKDKTNNNLSINTNNNSKTNVNSDNSNSKNR